jgi:hypothetical protein
MDRIPPIEPTPPWVTPIAPARPERDHQAEIERRKRRERPRDDRPRPGSERRADGEEGRGSDDGGSEGRHVDVRA